MKALPNVLYRSLVRGVDWNNRICGVDSAVADKPLAAWPGLPGDVHLLDSNPTTLYHIKVCVDSCTKTQDSATVLTPYNSTKCTCANPD